MVLVLEKIQKDNSKENISILSLRPDAFTEIRFFDDMMQINSKCDLSMWLVYRYSDWAIKYFLDIYDDNGDITYYEEEAIKIRNMLNSYEKDKKHQWRISADTLKTQDETLLTKEVKMNNKTYRVCTILGEKCTQEAVYINEQFMGNICYEYDKDTCKDKKVRE